MQDLLNDSIKKLGFGLLRLPRKDKAIDLPQVKIMVDMFMEAGFTYFDTAWSYQGSEDAIREALVERYPRDSFLLATKNAAWLGRKNLDEAICQFETSLRRTGAGYFDFYLLHNLGETRTQIFDQYDIWSFIRQKKSEGLIRHIGFSFHSTPEELDDILQRHPEMEFVQLQINYADWDYPAVQSRRCYEVARKHNKPVVIMEPVKGGLLANPPEPVLKILKNAEPERSAASWALRFAASLEGVLVVLSGMSNVEQMRDNIASMQDFHKLSEKEMLVIDKARAALKDIPLIPCTTCNYCAKVCPNNIGISGSFTAMNYLTLYGNKAHARGWERWFVGCHGKKSANECLHCGECEKVCPQHIAIREELDRVSAALGEALRK